MREMSHSVRKRNRDLIAIKRLAKDWRSAWLAGDAIALMTLFTDNPVVLPQGQPAIVGKDALRPLYEAVFREVVIKSNAKVIEVEASGDLGYFWATYSLTATPKAGGKSIKSKGKSLFIVKRQRQGAWKISRLIDNSDSAE